MYTSNVTTARIAVFIRLNKVTQCQLSINISIPLFQSNAQNAGKFKSQFMGKLHATRTRLATAINIKTDLIPLCFLYKTEAIKSMGKVVRMFASSPTYIDEEP